MVQLSQEVTQATFEPTTPVARRLAHARVIIGAVIVAGVAGISAARWWTGTGYQEVAAGLPDPGAITAVALPIAQYLHELAGVAVVGITETRVRNDKQAQLLNALATSLLEAGDSPGLFVSAKG